MNLLMLTSSYPKFPGDGTAPFIERIVREVARRGHGVDLVLPRHPELSLEGRAGGLPIRFFPYSAGGVWGYASSMAADRRLRAGSWARAPVAFLGAWRKLRSLAAANRYDLVHAHWVVPNGPAASLAARAAGIPLVISLHGSDVFVAERNPVLAAAARFVLSRSAWVTACSRDLGERGRRLGGADPEVIPYGVEIPESRSGDAPAWRARVGAAPDELLVVGLGRLVAKKGFSTLLQAACLLQQAGAPIRVAIGGDGDLAGRLAAEVREAGIERRVTLLGRVPHDQVPGLLAAADVIAVPSIVDESGNVDGLPNVLLEALAAGRPIVASAVGGIPDVLVDGVDSLLVAPGDASALAAALRRLRDQPAFAGRLADTARSRAAELPWSVYGARLVAGYERVLGVRG